MILIQPTVSQAIIFFTRAFSRDILIMFNASDTATMVGRPSGTAATIRTILVIKASDTVSQFMVWDMAKPMIWMANTIKAAVAPKTVITFPRRSSFSWRGVVSFSIEDNSFAICPNSVLFPTAVTTAFPVPLDTKQPEYSMFLRSATGVDWGQT